MSHPIIYPCFASQPRGSLLLYSLDKLLATIQTILVSFTSTFCVFLFRTLSDGNVFIYQLAARWAKAHRSVSTPMIKVGAIVCPRYHLFLLPIHISSVAFSSAMMVPSLRISGIFTECSCPVKSRYSCLLRFFSFNLNLSCCYFAQCYDDVFILGRVHQRLVPCPQLSNPRSNSTNDHETVLNPP